jgi:hypothetical protein
VAAGEKYIDESLSNVLCTEDKESCLNCWTMVVARIELQRQGESLIQWNTGCGDSIEFWKKEI